MSIIDERLHDIVETISLVESNSLLYFQKYVEGVNLTYYDCDETKPGCLPPTSSDKVRILGHIKHAELVNIPDENSCYYASMVVPIFQLLARRVNISVELFVSRYEENVDQLVAMEQGTLTTIDRVPILYNYDHDRNGQLCAPPLYLLNQIQIFSSKNPIVHSLEEIFKTFSINIWLIIFFFYLLCACTEIILYQKKSAESRWDTFINYFKVLMAKEAQTPNYNKIIYMFWLFGCIPLVEVFRNDMIAKVVDNKYRMIDNIEDLLKADVDIFASAGDMTLMRKTIDYFEYESVKKNFKKLFASTQIMSLRDSRWLDILIDPKKIIQTARRIVIIEDEATLKLFTIVLKSIVPIHLSSEKYISQYITPVCYNKNFPYAKELQVLTRELFEKGFLTYFELVKLNYVVGFGKRIFKMLAGDDAIDRIINQVSNEQTNTSLHEYILNLYLFLTIVNVVVFIFELVYYFMFDRSRRIKVNHNLSHDETKSIDSSINTSNTGISITQFIPRKRFRHFRKANSVR